MVHPLLPHAFTRIQEVKSQTFISVVLQKVEVKDWLFGGCCCSTMKKKEGPKRHF